MAWIRSFLIWSGSEASPRTTSTSATVFSITARASSAGAASAGAAPSQSASPTPSRQLLLDVIQILLVLGVRLPAVVHVAFPVLETNVADEDVPVDGLAPVLLDLLVVDGAPVHDVDDPAAVDRRADHDPHHEQGIHRVVDRKG